jgi:hypothetical protein
MSEHPQITFEQRNVMHINDDSLQVCVDAQKEIYKIVTSGKKNERDCREKGRYDEI